MKNSALKKITPFHNRLKVFCLLSLLLSLPLLIVNPSPAAAAVRLLAVSELKNLLDDPHCVIVDTRNFFAYRRGHIKAAVSLDAGCSGPLVDKNGAVPCRLLAGRDIVGELARNGICPERKIILYGDQHSWGAEGRLYWLLDKLGFRDLALLDGGYDAWQQFKGPTSAIFADRRPPCSHLETAALPALEKRLRGLSGAMLWQRFERGEVIFLDVRSRQEYQGAVLYREKRGGHLPGALNFDWENFWQEDYRLKKPATSIAELQECGLPSPAAIGDKMIVPYCTGGIRSGYAWFVLKWLGYARVENYDPGFWEWAADAMLPLENPASSR